MELLLGQIPEAIFFALFMIYAKGIKEKMILFTILMIIEYLLLKQIIHFNIWFQITYTFITFIILKMLYKQKAQITDIFTFTIASVFLIITSVLSFAVCFGNTIIATLLNRFILFVFIYIFREKLINIQLFYKKIWNKETNKTKIKSTTFRSINIVIFNIIFCLLDSLMLFAIYYNSL